MFCIEHAFHHIKFFFGTNAFIPDIKVINYLGMLVGIFIVFTKFKSFNSSNSHEQNYKYSVRNPQLVLRKTSQYGYGHVHAPA